MRRTLFVRLLFLFLFALAAVKGLPYFLWASPYLSLLVAFSAKKVFFWMLPSLFLLLLCLKRNFFCNILCPVGTLLLLLPSFHLPFPKVFGGFCTPFLFFTATLSLLGANILIFDPLVAFSRVFTKVWTSPILFFFAMNAFGKRRWCRDCCPLGALLSLPKRGFSYFSRQRRSLLLASLSAIILSSFRKEEKKLLLPPNAKRDFHLLCTRCTLCEKVCPEKIITPFITVHIPYLLLPTLSFVEGSCQRYCNECSRVCPTGAIAPYNIEEKPGIRIGLAKVERKRCIYYKWGSECLICLEHCPYGAIKLKEAPFVDRRRCTGCGMCEHLCPVGAVKVYPEDEKSRRRVH